MAFAKLIFPANTPVLKKLKDIAKVCTGAATAISQLEAATQATSILVATEPAGWQMADATSALEATGTATKSEYRISAPCVNTGKIKYAALKCFNPLNQYLGTSTEVSVTFPNSTATAGSLITTIGSGVASNALVSEAAFVRKAGIAYRADRYFADASAVDIGSATEIFVSVTNRKIIVATTAAVNAITAVLEFPETLHTTTFSNVPFIMFSGSSLLTDFTTSPAGQVSTSFDATSNTVYVSSGYYSTASAAFYRVSALTNWFSRSTSTRSIIGTNSPFFTHAVFTTPPLTFISDTLLAYPLQEMVSVRTDSGEGIHNYSRLTETYLTNRQPTTITNGAEIVTSGGATYVILTIGNPGDSNNMRSICIKKA